MEGREGPTWAALLLLFAAAAAVSAQSAEYPPLDGVGNNKENPTWGAAGTPYIRQQVPQDAFGTTGSAMAGSNRPSARAVSLALTNNPYFKASSRYNTSYLLSALGQLVSGDINRLNAEAGSNGGAAPIPIPPGDPLFAQFKDGAALLQGSRPALNFTRSAFVMGPGPNASRQAVNDATSFIDASCLYGESANVTQAIRTGTAGLLLDDGQRMLPFNRDRDTGRPILPMKNVAGRVPVTQLRMSGNKNINQNPLPMTLTTLLLREHNRRALQLAQEHPNWEDEDVFQGTRKWVVAHMQRITLVDYLTGLGIPLPPYPGYNASLNPTTDTFFSTVAYRYGHSTIGDVILRLGPDWTEHPKGHLSMAASYYNPNVVLAAGLEPLLRGLIAMPQADIESRWSASVSGNLFGMSTINGTDLAAINIQRGRDHGIPDYNTCRRLMGLPPAKTFQDITPDPTLASTLQQLYGNVNNVDAYVGGLAEPHYQQAHVGQLFYLSIKDQFTRLRDGDFWYFENAAANKLFSAAEVDEIRRTSLRDLILRNTNISSDELPQDIWTAVGAGGSCANPSAGSSSGAGAQQRLATGVLNGQGNLEVTPGSEDGWVNVKLTAAGTGWLGFGVAQQGTETPMIGADMVVGRVANGVPQVKRYHAVGHIPPEEATDASTNERIRGASFHQSGGTVSMEFERPIAASGDAANDGTLGMPLDGPVTLIMARGPGNGFSDLGTDYHGFTNREIIRAERLFGPSSGIAGVAATPSAIAKRRAHGILMTTNFMVVMPLGALAARQLRCHWLKNPAVRASLFYVHIATQVTGLIITTVGFIIATRLFGIKYDQVAFSHGRIGVAILVLIYSQLLMGLARPAASAPTMRRHAWDVGHTVLGRAAMMLGVLNAILGIFIFVSGYGGSLAHWLGLCAAALATINLLQYILDRQEKFAVLKRDRDLASVTNAVTAKDVTDDAAGGSPRSKHAGSWVARNLTASNLKRHQAATASAAAATQPLDGPGGFNDGIGGISHGDLQDDVAGFGARGFGEPSGGDAYAYDSPDHGMFGQPPHEQQQFQQYQQQQQQYQPGIPNEDEFSFGPAGGPSAAVHQQQQSFEQRPLQPPLPQQQQAGLGYGQQEERLPPPQQQFGRF